MFLKSQIIILFFLAANIFIRKRKITLRQYLLSIIFKSSLQNSNWFAFTIIIFYIYAYLSFYISKKIHFGLIILNIICFIHVYFVYNYYYPRIMHTVETTLSFVSGFYYSMIHKKIETILMKNDIRYLVAVSAIICIYYNFNNTRTIIKRSFWNLSFALLVILISMKIRIKNEFLKFLNDHSYSIYLFQRLIFIIV